MELDGNKNRHLEYLTGYNHFIFFCETEMEWMSVSYIDLFKQQEFNLMHEHK